MKTIVLATQKGGAGKSTLARTVAVEASRRGQRVAMLDLDPQGTLTKWWNRREAEDLQLVTGLESADAIGPAIAKLREAGYDLLVIDTPGHRDEVTRMAMASADLAIVPVHPTTDDLDAVGPTLGYIREAGVEFIFALSRTKRARLVDEVTRFLARYGRVAPVNIADRVAHGEATANGMTASEAGNRPAAQEAVEFYDYVLEVLK